MGLAQEIARMIEDALARLKLRGDQLPSQIPSDTLPPASGSSPGAVTLSDDLPAAVGTAAAGSATDVSRADHIHAHGNQAGGTLHAAATTSVAGFLSASDKTKLDAYPAISSLTAGQVLTALSATTIGFAAAAAVFAVLRQSPAILPMTALGAGTNPVLVADTSTYDAFPGMTVRGDGALLLVYREATNHASSKGVVRARTSATNGATWSAAATYYSHATYDARDPSITRLRDGTLMMSFFLYDQGALTCFTDGAKIILSSDDGATWGSPVTLPTFGTQAALSAPVVELRDGTLLQPMYGKDAGNWYVRIARSTNGGSSWSSLATIDTGDDLTEPWIVERPDGSLLMSIRNETDDQVAFSTSTDAGATWSTPANAFAGRSRAALLVTRSGLILAVFRRATTGNTETYLRWSLDDGTTWGGPWVVGASADNYGVAVEYAPGLILVAYATESSGTDADLRVRAYAEGHPAASAYTAGGAASGDLAGTYPDPTVVALQGNAVAATAPATSDVLFWDGTAWTPGTVSVLTNGDADAPELVFADGDVVMVIGG